MGDVVLPTTQQRFGIGAVYRWNFGRSPTSPTLRLGVGFNKAAFTIEKAAAPAGVTLSIPNVDYTYLSPGLAFRYPFTPKIAAGAEFHYLIVSALGEMQQSDQYGSASIFAFDVDLGVDVRLLPSIVAVAGVRLVRFGMKFDGSGSLTDRNGDSTQDVQSAADQYLGLYAGAAYEY
jgi:hypothetical protein